MISDNALRQLAELEKADESPIPSPELRLLLKKALYAISPVSAAEKLSSRRSELVTLGQGLVSRYGLAGRGAFAVALVSHLAIRRANESMPTDLPPSVAELYPAAYDRLVRNLTTVNPTQYWLKDDGFLKDLRFVSGLTVPCGAQDVDLASRITVGSLIRAALAFSESRHVLRLAALGLAPWFRIHTDSRFLDEFTEEGWKQCYHRISQLLVRSPRTKGMVGTSWFYDPELPGISPRLAYLQDEPLQHGAFLVCHGSNDIDTERAISKSETRRRLHRAGKYLPVCYSLFWPRRDLVAWAEQHPGLGR